jgi:hypothetical protein
MLIHSRKLFVKHPKKQCERKKVEFDFLYYKHFLQFSAKSVEGSGYEY